MILLSNFTRIRYAMELAYNCHYYKCYSITDTIEKLNKTFLKKNYYSSSLKNSFNR